MKLSMKHSMDFRAHHVHPHPMVFAYVFLTFATFPSNLMDSITEGGIPPLLIWRRAKAASIKFDGNVANVRKTYANTYQIFVHLDILWILWYFPYVVPGAIYLAESVAPYIYILVLTCRLKSTELSASLKFWSPPINRLDLPVGQKWFVDLQVNQLESETHRDTT